MNEDVVLECRELLKHYDGVAALDGVSVQFAAGVITAIVGPNGAGKTTLLNVISGFQRCESGEIIYRDRNIGDLQPEQISRLGIARTFQRSRVITELTVLENVLLAASRDQDESLAAAMFGRPSRVRRAQLRDQAERAIAYVGLTGHHDRLGGELSYGQQKLLSLAACIGTDARTILLDEPLSGVAPQMIEQILRILHDLAGGGYTIIFIEHDLVSVNVASNRVLGMHHGKIVSAGTPAEVLSNPALVEAFLE